jgi:hypothetical protein
MVNYIVKDLDALLDRLNKTEKIDAKRTNESHGHFDWIYDLDVNQLAQQRNRPVIQPLYFYCEMGNREKAIPPNCLDPCNSLPRRPDSLPETGNRNC